MSFDVFDVAASGMRAQRVKMDAISSNVANINTTRKPDGTVGPYIKKDVSFKAIYDERLSQGASNFSSNSTAAQFDPATGKITNKKVNPVIIPGAEAIQFDPVTGKITYKKVDPTTGEITNKKVNK